MRMFIFFLCVYRVCVHRGICPLVYLQSYISFCVTWSCTAVTHSHGVQGAGII
jgi:hypothetical protein